MSNYDELNAKADAEMEEFLKQTQQSQSNDAPPSQPNSQQPQGPQIDEADFVADDETDDVAGQQGQQLGNTTPPSEPQQSATQPQTTFTMEQLEYERRLAEERGRNAAYYDLVVAGNKPNTTQETEAKPYFQPEELEITPEERAQFSEETAAFAQKIANRAVDKILRDVVAPLQQEVLSQREQLAGYGSGMANTKARMLYSSVQSHVPDLPTIVASQEWKQFMEQPTPIDSNIKMGQVFLNHLHQGNEKDILAFIKMFKTQYPANQMQQQMAPGQASMGTPPTLTPDRKPKQYSYRKYQQALQRYNAGQMSYAEYKKIEELYDQAAAEGRIKYD